jgi:glycolate oxidase FAD binding subunit
MTLTPSTTEALSTALREASAANRTLTPTGGRTKQTWGNPISTDDEISTKNLTGILDHSWQDLTATVAAGTTWSAMQQELAQHGQQVALDPIFPAHATVGGILATNDSGLLRLKYGSLRDLILGMTIVLADGTIARTGGKVVKNVAGYDLPKLLTGSFGTLGIIAEATFRLHPLPQHTSHVTVRAQEIAPIADLMTSILQSSFSLERMQLRTEALAYAPSLPRSPSSPPPPTSFSPASSSSPSPRPPSSRSPAPPTSSPPSPPESPLSTSSPTTRPPASPIPSASSPQASQPLPNKP